MDVYTPEVRKNRKRRRAYSIISLSLLFIYLVLLGAIWLVLRSPFFHLKRISIEGNATVSNGTVMDLLQSRVMKGRFANALLGFDNILIWPTELAQVDLAFVPEVKNLKIDKDYRAMTVSVDVEEREPYGIWCLTSPQINADETQMSADSISENQRQNLRISAVAAGDECWWFDKKGIIFKRALTAEGSLVTAVDDYSQKNLGLYSPILPPDFMADVFSIFGVLKSSGLRVAEIRLNDLALQELEVLTYPSTPLGASDGLPAEASAKAGPKLYFSLRFPADNDLAVIENLAAKSGFKNLEYIDFRVENRVYYK
jgi:hypothetical protein